MSTVLSRKSVKKTIVGAMSFGAMIVEVLIVGAMIVGAMRLPLGDYTVLNVQFYIRLRSHGVLIKWSWKCHGISFPDVCENPVNASPYRRTTIRTLQYLVMRFTCCQDFIYAIISNIEIKLLNCLHVQILDQRLWTIRWLTLPKT